MKIVCEKCLQEFESEEPQNLCPACSQKRRNRWKKIAEITLTILGVSVITYLIHKVVKANDTDDLDNIEDISHLAGNSDLGISASETSAISFPKGEKYFNPMTQNWEKDGKPYLYRVKYFDSRDGQLHVNDYTDIDDGYEYYEWLKKRGYSSKVTWDHIAPEDQSE